MVTPTTLTGDPLGRLLGPARAATLRRPILLASSAVALAMAVAGWGQLALVLAVLAAAATVSAVAGWVTRLFLGGTAVAVWMIVVATLADLAALPLPPPLLAATALVASVSAAWFLGDFSITTRRGDAVVLGVAALGVGLAVPKMTGSTADHVARLVYGYDSGNHVRYSLAMGQAHGYTYHLDSVPGLYGQTAYRPAQAFLTEYLPWILRGGYGSPTVSQSLAFAESVYSLQIVALAVAAVLLVRELVDGIQDAGSAPSGAATAWACAVVGAVVLLGISPAISQRGFQAQSMASIAMVTGVLFLCLGDKRSLSTSAAVVGAAGCIALAANAWPLAAGPLVAATAFAVLRRLREVSWWAWCAMAALGAVAAYPVYGPPVFYKDATWLSNTSSAVLPLPPSTWGSLAVLGAMGLAGLARSPGGAVGLRTMVSAAVGGVATILGVAAVQHFTTGDVGGYYLAKSVYAVAILSAVGTGALVWSMLSSWSGPVRLASLVLTACLVLVACLPLMSFSVQTYWRAPSRDIYEAGAVTAALRDYPNGAPADRDVVVLGVCRPTASDYTTRWLGTVLRTWTSDRDALVARLGTQGESLAALQTYAAAQSARRIDVFADPACPLAHQIEGARIPNVTLRYLP